MGLPSSQQSLLNVKCACYSNVIVLDVHVLEVPTHGMYVCMYLCILVLCILCMCPWTGHLCYILSVQYVYGTYVYT